MCIRDSNYSDLLISQFPGSSIEISFKTNGLKQLPPHLLQQFNIPENSLTTFSNYDLNVTFKLCERGDIYTDDGRCQECTNNTYSLALGDPSQMKTCQSCNPDIFSCYGGQKIEPKAGYWRFDKFSDNFISCPNKDACLGGGYNQGKYSGLCANNYTGNLCADCMPGFAKFGKDSTCRDCKTDWLYYIGLGFMFLLQLLLVCYNIKCNIDLCNGIAEGHDISEENFESNLMKILTSYFQIISLVSSFSFKWPTQFTSLFEVNARFSVGSQEYLSVDCFYALIFEKSPLKPLYLKMITILVLPIIILIVCPLIWYLYYQIRKQDQDLFKPRIVTSLVVIIFMLQPFMIQSALTFFDCKNLGSTTEPRYFVDGHYDIECWASSHTYWALFAAAPCLIFWGIALPLFLFNILRANKHNLKDRSIAFNYSYIYMGYREQKYFWEFIIMARKFIIISILVFVSRTSLRLQALLGLLVFQAAYLLQDRHNPFGDKKLNDLERSSLICSGIVIYGGLYFLITDIPGETDKTIVMFCCILAHAFFLYHWARAWLTVFKKKINGIVESIQRVFAKCFGKTPDKRVATVPKAIHLNSAQTRITKANPEFNPINNESTVIENNNNNINNININNINNNNSVNYNNNNNTSIEHSQYSRANEEEGASLFLQRPAPIFPVRRQSTKGNRRRKTVKQSDQIFAEPSSSENTFEISQSDLNVYQPPYQAQYNPPDQSQYQLPRPAQHQPEHQPQWRGQYQSEYSPQYQPQGGVYRNPYLQIFFLRISLYSIIDKTSRINKIYH
eukprot:TRINITY_DN2915_c0_g1_i4.p1 TRINITY_DN2915_c0_g1~~TRINITY_DN2915_c0_g1_i4.p1  ORF type:complete len:788 (+),score=114.56 TRINITY_DN2915_c0_g1_i4:64-2427(+)